mmetsp:Transcript_21501/g.30113  ORF Transcript_21501/g.30113 Transcript_21501/m.30113 type:complete len:857 (-) Transcript_21501:163-2733(-)|eukprot:CAMPEP_0184871334 /NCGR_PEP_ID=MMETSP0580-20130426/40657_1 /TAXON_ID=1118495 /ORGANISM="Dactyliosolen fragilissimus" /LENGTH=856 /DNA_ID=CAMNT_0027373977 /DNA_START=145 /DNA_END=2715 /DNA_ORIENTATION=+
MSNYSLHEQERFLGGGGGSEFGVHIAYEDLYNAVVFLVLIYGMGYLGEKLLKLPSLVGQIFAGIIWGPAVLNLAPYPEAWVLFGEIGLIFLVIEAGVDIDVATLKLIGLRGVIIAIIGSVAPIAIGLAIAFILGEDSKAAIAAGSAFGPTSLGIAVNILKTSNFINTPTGQLIVAAAIIDDMIALIILSQLKGLAGTITVQGVLIPVISALAFLILGGYIALRFMPIIMDTFVYGKLMEKFHTWKRNKKLSSSAADSNNHDENQIENHHHDISKDAHGRVAIMIMMGLLLGLMPATFYTKASHLMGAFIAGLAFCTDHDLHSQFISQFKRVLQWLMRIFFAATIGFQVPIKNFGDGKVIWKGLLFTLALIGKLAVGILVPNFTQERRFTGSHLRDCLIVGCSMAAEGEFAFVIAAFSVDKGLISADLYSSIVLAILLSTVIAPFSLRFTINHFANKRAIAEIERAEQLTGNDTLSTTSAQKFDSDLEQQLKLGIKEGTTIFLWINTTSHANWGTLPKLMKAMFDLKIEIIDHRSWHSRFDDTVVNEIYAKETNVNLEGVDASRYLTDIGEQNLMDHLEDIENSIKKAIGQKDAVVSVGRWLPGVVEDIIMDENEEYGETSSLIPESESKQKNKDNINITQKIMNEVQNKFKSSELESKGKGGKQTKFDMTTIDESSSVGASNATAKMGNMRRRRVRTASTPLSGGDMFAQPSGQAFQPTSPRTNRRRMKTMSVPMGGQLFDDGKGTGAGNTLAARPLFLGPEEVLVEVITKPVPKDNANAQGDKIPVVTKEEKFITKMRTSTLHKLRNDIPITLSDFRTKMKSNNQGLEFLDGYVRLGNKARTRQISNLSMASQLS